MFCVLSPALSVRFYLVGFRLKTTGEQIDDRVVEVHWDPALSGWRMMRFRDDKPHGNHKSVVENIIQTIADGVEKETVRSLFFTLLRLEKLQWVSFFLQLLERCAPIRNAWKARLGQQPSQSGPPPSLPHPHPSLPPSHVQPSQKYSQWGPPVPFKYGPIAQSPWSKVAGPTVIAGLKR